MEHHYNDSAESRHRIEVALVAMRLVPSIRSPEEHMYNDPFILYQDGIISKRKFIEYIANELTRE